MKKQSLEDVYKSYAWDIYRYLLSLCFDHYLAEDIMQETFYRAYLFLEDCPGDKVKPWLFRVAYNAFVDAKRKSSKNTVTEDDFFKDMTDFKTPEDEVIIREQLREIGSIVGKLPEAQKHAILLCDMGGLSYREAADAMNVSPNHFKILLFRARQKIRQIQERNDRYE